jgi:hypothetical protein
VKTGLFFLMAVGGYAITFLAACPKVRKFPAHVKRMAEAQRIVDAHAKCTDCYLEICLLSHDEAFYYCRTHDLVHLMTDPIELYALRQKIRALQQGGR